MELSAIQALNIPKATKPRIVVIGGGFAGFNFIKALNEKHYQVVLLDRNNYNVFQPLLYQVATGGLNPDAIANSFRHEFRERKNFFVRTAEVLSVCEDNKTVKTSLGNLDFDYLVIASGSLPNFFGNKQIAKTAMPLKTLADALDLKAKLLNINEKLILGPDPATREKLLNIAIVGGGPTGVELAGALAEIKKHVLPKDYPEGDFSHMRVILIEGCNRLLPSMSAFSSRKTKKYLLKMGVELKLDTLVADYSNENIFFSDGTRLPCSTLIWSAGIQGNLIDGLNAESIEKTRVCVDRYCRVSGSKVIFAIGDISLMKTTNFPFGHPCVVQPAMQMGSFLGKNFLSIINGSQKKPFEYFDKGSMATIGRSKAVADLSWNIKSSGFIAWLMWLVIHWGYLRSTRNMLLVIANWLWSFFTYDKGNKLLLKSGEK